ncbi:uncharacterized protein LOC123269545 [Cotesia glomerata]|uniref:Uncharacterized protein n=1 Tax=Cotesia glomerata TaxID=32391 RepID=A0AAV7I7H2_COTGL|nr:uncharacterized protein LOC123269545 [Cotesia glomerata]KAH0546131.1 hypothetical protein KQX54_006735 [Cotesia glomerata]
MASPDEKSSATEERNSEDNSSSGEWTLIGDKESADSISISNSIDGPDNDDNNEDHADQAIDTEEAREAIQILGESLQVNDKKTENKEQDDVDEDKNITEALVPCNDESDGISVITDYERNDDNLYRSLTEIIKPIDNIVLPSGTVVHILIACTLAATVGFGIGLFVGPGKTQMSPTPTIPLKDVNFKHMNAESENSLYRSDELKQESHLLKDNNEFSVFKKPKIDNVNNIGTYETDYAGKGGSIKPINIKNVKNGSLREILDKVKLSLDTLCSIIERSDTSYRTSVDFACHRRSLMDLLDLKDSVQSIMTGIELTEELSNKRFIENMESKIKNISLTFFDDLSKTLKNSVVKVHRKLVKVRRKLNQRLCLIRNTMGDDPKLSELLDKMNLKSNNCNKTNKSEKFNEKKINDEKKIKNKKPEKNHQYPVGPEVKREFDKQKFKMDSKDRNKQNGRNDKGEYGEMKRQFKSQQDHKDYSISESKSNDLNAKIIRDTARLKPNAPPVDKWKDKKSYDKKDDDSVCYGKSCGKQRNNDRKNSFEKNENWQFKRSEGRDYWRIDKKPNDKKENSWDFNRAKGRENARINY